MLQPPVNSGPDTAVEGERLPKRLSAQTLIRRHKARLQEQAASGDGSLNSAGGPRPVKQVIMSEAYPASCRSIRDLDIVTLDTLRVGQHHRGQGLVVKAVTPAFRGVGAVSIVVDRLGNADKLAIYNHSDTSLLSNLPEGCVVAVKEPYYQRTGKGSECMLCIDHPSDVLLLRFDDPLIPPALRPSEAEQAVLRKTPEAWRQAGDMAFLQRDLPTAAYW